MLCLTVHLFFSESLQTLVLSLAGIALLIGIDVSLESLKLRRRPPVLLKLVRGPWNLCLEAHLRLPFGWVCQTGEEITRRLPGWAEPSLLFEVAPGMGSWAKVDFTPFV